MKSVREVSVIRVGNYKLFVYIDSDEHVIGWLCLSGDSIFITLKYP